MVRESIIEVAVDRSSYGVTTGGHDLLAVEEPLEIQLNEQRVSVTMRTPGNDEELALGFLFTEGIVRDHRDVAAVRPCDSGRVVRVRLLGEAPADLHRLDRRGYVSSSCGVCGKSSIDALGATAPWPVPQGTPLVDAAIVATLPEALRDAQRIFASTGGLHASALFEPRGGLRLLREDVGRHNALDKVIGAELLAGRLPATESILLLSGRVSFELVQKAWMAAIPIVAAIGAPSSLAVELARRAGITLVGFIREGRFTVYSCPERLSSRALHGCHPERRRREGSVPCAAGTDPSVATLPQDDR